MLHLKLAQPIKRFWIFGGILVIAALGTRIWAHIEKPDVPRLRGLPEPIRPIHIIELPIDELQARLDLERRKNAGADARCQRLAMFYLGLISTVEPMIVPPYESWLEKIFAQPTVPAFYVGGTDTIYTIDRSHPAIRHEWVHAIDDQHAMRISRSGENLMTTDERLALRAAIEGTAQVLNGLSSVPLPLEPDLDRSAWAFAYNVGPLYIKRQARHDPHHLFSLVPRTTHAVLYDETINDPVPIPAPLLQSNERLLCSDRLGALALLVAFKITGPVTNITYHVARSWAGDRLDLILADHQHRARWHIAFSDSLAAQAWLKGPAIHLSRFSSIPIQMETTIISEER